MSRTLWVDAERGNDENDGSEAWPLRTLVKAAAVVEPGDTVLVAPGDYRGPLVISTDDTTWRNAEAYSLAWQLVRVLPFLARWIRRPQVVIHVPPGTVYWVHIHANDVNLIGFDMKFEDAWTAA